MPRGGQLMRRLWLALALSVTLAASYALAQTPPTGSAVNGWLQAIFNQLSDPGGAAGSRVAITGSSGNVANANAVATLPGVALKTTYICGFTFTSTGSTAAAVVAPTVTGTITGTLTYSYATVAGATLGNTPLIVAFGPCVPASAVNTPIVATLPALGAGNTNATATAWGYQR